MQVRNATSAVVEQPALSILQPLGEEHHAHVLHGSGGRETQHSPDRTGGEGWGHSSRRRVQVRATAAVHKHTHQPLD